MKFIYNTILIRFEILTLFFNIIGQAYQRPIHFGQLIPSTSSRLGYPRVRNPYDFSWNQEFLPVAREQAPSKTWRNGYRQIPKNSWNRDQPKSWLPERDYFEETNDEDKSWEQQKQWRQNLRVCSKL